MFTYFLEIASPDCPILDLSEVNISKIMTLLHLNQGTISSLITIVLYRIVGYQCQLVLLYCFLR